MGIDVCKNCGLSRCKCCPICGKNCYGWQECVANQRARPERKVEWVSIYDSEQIFKKGTLEFTEEYIQKLITKTKKVLERFPFLSVEEAAHVISEDRKFCKQLEEKYGVDNIFWA